MVLLLNRALALALNVLSLYIVETQAWSGRSINFVGRTLTTRRFLQTKTIAASPLRSSKSDQIEVTVFGGTGFVGSRVCKILVEDYSSQVSSITSVSRSGDMPAWCQDASEEWTDKVDWKKGDLLSSSSSAEFDVGSTDVAISCIGVVGLDRDELKSGNGDANVAAFSSVEKTGKLQKAIYVSVSSEVAACQENWLPDFFGGYFEGKSQAEEAALNAVRGDASRVCLVKPTFIYGGDSFGLFPPRVNDDYGSGVEQLLMLTPFKILADLTPGLIKVALRPPVSVQAVAKACAKAAVDDGGALKTLDGTEEINAYAGQPPSEGLSNAIEWGGVQLGKAYDWAKIEVPKAIELAKKKYDELQQK